MSDTTSKQNILLAEDDLELAELLCEYLTQQNFNVVHAADGNQAWNEINHTSNYDLILLDVMMPGLDGIEILKRIRQQHLAVSVIMLTAKGDDVDRIIGLELGADDYLAKPCNPRELVARIRAVLRRFYTEPSTADRLVLHGLTVNAVQLKASLHDIDLKVTIAEMKLLAVLIEHQGRAVSKDELSQVGLNRERLPFDRSVDVHISHLRKKLARVDRSYQITALRGVGYQLVIAPNEDEE
ncbi:response regulator transcription factor [uncultured Umboniibacter sp.]|uniref:response regulator transcription factor n=1 Tax=uncultured Umboniibacter sp. TaxID=1798917 RepID=UPI00260F2DEA|nr:response regulator transcription factor [uncultured Umboniibacter sp.]